MFGYDESDYAYAASKGFQANWSGLGDPSFTEFVSLGRAHWKGSGEMARERMRLSPGASFLQHYHGPLLSYWIASLARWSPTERFLRWWSCYAILAVAAIAWAWVACQVVAHNGGLVFLGTLSAFLLCVMAIERQPAVSPHCLFASLIILPLHYCSERRFSDGRFSIAGAAALMSFLVVCLQYWVLVAVVCFYSVWQTGFGSFATSAPWRAVVRIVALAVMFLLFFTVLLWGKALPFGLAESLAFFASESVGGLIFRPETPSRYWWMEFGPVQLIVLLALVLSILLWSREGSVFVKSCSCFAVLLVVINLPLRQLRAQNLVSLCGPVSLFAGIALTSGGAARWKVAAVVTLCLGALSYLGFTGGAPARPDPRRQLSAIISTELRSDELLMAPQSLVPTLGFYLRPARVLPERNPDQPPQPDVWLAKKQGNFTRQGWLVKQVISLRGEELLILRRDTYP